MFTNDEEGLFIGAVSTLELRYSRKGQNGDAIEGNVGADKMGMAVASRIMRIFVAILFLGQIHAFQAAQQLNHGPNGLGQMFLVQFKMPSE